MANIYDIETNLDMTYGEIVGIHSCLDPMIRSWGGKNQAPKDVVSAYEKMAKLKKEIETKEKEKKNEDK